VEKILLPLVQALEEGIRISKFTFFVDLFKGGMRRLILRSGVLLFLLMTVLGLHAQTFTAYPLRDSGGNLIYAGNSGDDYDLLTDGSGNLHLLWSEGGVLYYGRVVYNSASAQYRVTGKEYTQVNFYMDGVNNWFTQPRAAVRRDGQTVHFIWGETLKHAWRNAQGVWSKETVRNISGIQKCRAPSIVVEDNETVHILYGYYDGSNGDDPTHLIYQRKPAGGSWSGSMELDITGYNQGAEWRNPVMTLDAQGGIHATWSNQIYWTTPDGAASRYRYAPAGTGLETSTTGIIHFSNGVFMYGVGNIFVDPAGKVHRTLCSNLSTIDYTSKPSGASGAWATPSRASIGVMQAPEDVWASVTTDSCGRVLVAFADGPDQTNYHNLYLSVLDTGVWTKYTISTSAGLDFFRQPSLVSAAGTLVMLWRENSGLLYLATTPDSCGSLTINAPGGGERWTVGESRDIIWTSTGTVGSVNIDYSTDSGATWTSIVSSTANDGLHRWTVPNTPSSTCLLRVREVDGSPTGISNSVFSIIAYVDEVVSAPLTPTGPTTGAIGINYNFSCAGSISSLGHTLQYKFDWDNGMDSGWLAEGATGAAHFWAANGTYHVRAMARCATHTTSESLWSTTLPVIISGSVTGHYNSPAQYKVLPEVIWAPATGSGTWMSEMQITDISGGSQVSVYYNTAAGRRGPFPLWNNSGGALSSVKYSNLLATIDGLDSGVFTYYGTIGAVEFVTQDAAHVVQVTARTLNGNYSKTSPAFSLHDSNTADISRVMTIPNLTNNSSYRSTCGLFNPTADAVTVELRLRNAADTQIGTTISKTINGYGFSAFLPFNEAGRAYPDYSYDNVSLSVQPVSGSGKVFCFGASANNATNDPATHIAVQNGSGHDNGPSNKQILPEAIWAPATGGGTWMSEVQIDDVTGGSAVSAYFDYGGGSRRGPFALWTGSGAGTKVKYANILQQLGTIDSGFTYYGRLGTLEFQTQDGAHTIQVTARTLNSNNSKTFPGLNLVDAETADTSRAMLIQNYANNSTYRSTCGFFNPTANSVTVEFTLLNGSGSQIGAKFSRTFVGYDFQAFNPFNEAGMPYPANAYDNVILRVRPTSGSGRVVCFGASASNVSNDPAAHIAVQAQ
jgi:hypothetical protein